MKRIALTTLVLVIATLLSLTSTAHAANLLTNSGFETGDSSGWSLWNPGGNTNSVVAGGSGGSAYSNKWDITGSGTAEAVIYQYQPITTGQPYTFTGDLKSDAVSNAEAFLKIQFHKTSGYSPTGPSYTSAKLTSASGWTSYSLTTSAAPSDATYAELGFVLQGLGGGTGSAQFDNGYADVVPEPASLLLLGSGLLGLFGVARKKR